MNKIISFDKIVLIKIMRLYVLHTNIAEQECIIDSNKQFLGDCKYLVH